jgi:hypothetical protein
LITGKVSGTDKTSLQGVTISVPGTKIQTITNADGTYSIAVPANATELVFTYVNSRAVTEKINGRKVIDVQMITESVQLGEVVVVGYGTQKKANLTGAVAKVYREYCPILISGCLMESLTRLPDLIFAELHPLARVEMH